jgi:hypothetical protein
MTMTAKKPQLRTFADLVDLADSGETEGLILGGKNKRGDRWYQMPVEVNPDLPAEGANVPGAIVFVCNNTTWTYEAEKLRTNPRLREAIKRTAEMRRNMDDMRARGEIQ